MPSSTSLQAEVGHLDAVGAAGQPGLVGEHHRDEDAEAEGGDGEVVALEPQDRAADQPGEDARDGGAEDGGEAGMQARDGPGPGRRHSRRCRRSRHGRG